MAEPCCGKCPGAIAIGTVRYPTTGGNVGVRWFVEPNGTMPQAGETAYVLAAPTAPAVVREEMSKAVADALAERRRQIEAEGWTPEHDDEHDPGNLAAAGAAYALNAANQIHPYTQGDGGNKMPICWPWDAEWWKPKTPRRDLVRAAALILAEIEKMDRETKEES